MRRHGKVALEQADARLGRAPAVAISRPPPVFEGDAPERNIIAYTLFGASPRYCESAVKNAQVATELFAQWRCRVYLDDTVPRHVRQRLRQAGGGRSST